MPSVDPNLYIPAQQGMVSIGFPDAPHELRIFFSPTCSHCVEYHRYVMPNIIKRYVERGVIRLTPLLFVRHAVDMYLTKIFLCRGLDQMYPSFLVWFEQMEDWVPIFLEGNNKKKQSNMQTLMERASQQSKLSSEEIINALKINMEDPDYRHYVALYALINGYKVEEIIMALDDDKLERTILSMKEKAVDNDGNIVTHIPATYWNNKYIEGIPDVEAIDKLIYESHANGASTVVQEKKVEKEQSAYKKPDEPLRKNAEEVVDNSALPSAKKAKE